MITVIGDTLLDVDIRGRARRLCPDAPAPVIDVEGESVRAGGAGLAATMLAGDGEDVVLITALPPCDTGRAAQRVLRAAGVTVANIADGGTLPRKTRVIGDRRVLARLDTGGPPGVGEPDARAREAVWHADCVLVSDYAQGTCLHAGVRSLVAGAHAPVVWDPHRSGGAPIAGVDLVTPNDQEAAALGGPGCDASALRAVLGVRAVAITRGAGGAEFCDSDGPVRLIAAPRRLDGVDPLGAGDRLAGAAAGAMAGGATPEEATGHAVAAATDFLAAGGVAGQALPQPQAADADAFALAARTRARGGRVVATSGCFDLLHPGHLSSLEAARTLGDCLVVLLNSDASVSRLKGRGRPLVGQRDRARMLMALAPVDAVVVFDDDTPEALLRRLRPHVFAKGADHDGAAIPEAALMRELGGCIASLPRVGTMSTTQLERGLATNGARTDGHR